MRYWLAPIVVTVSIVAFSGSDPMVVVSKQAVRVSFGNASKAVRKDGIWTDEHIGEIINTKMAKSLEKALG